MSTSGSKNIGLVYKPKHLSWHNIYCQFSESLDFALTPVTGVGQTLHHGEGTDEAGIKWKERMRSNMRW